MTSEVFSNNKLKSNTNNIKYKNMALGINETIESETRKSKHMVYRDGVKVQFAKSTVDISACILPAIADHKDKSSYLPYRREDQPELFTKWAVGMRFHPFVNKELNIISTTTFDPSAFDPIDELIKVAKNDPEFSIIAGYDETGKKMMNAYKNPNVRLSSRWTGYVVNASIMYNKDIDPNKSTILQIPGTAFRRSGQQSPNSSMQWGLLSELNKRDRKNNDYYWGDVTDPTASIPCKLALTANPAGGISIYNMVPDPDPDEPNGVKISRATLESRYDLDEIFYETTEAEIMDKLIFLFSDVPKLIKLAFSNRVPNLDKLLSRVKSVKVQMPSMDEEEDGLDGFDIPAPKAKTKEVEQSQEANRSFSPSEEDFGAPAKDQDSEIDEIDIDAKVVSIPTRKKTSIRSLMD
jgi:hypothetical protein